MKIKIFLVFSLLGTVFDFSCCDSYCQDVPQLFLNKPSLALSPHELGIHAGETYVVKQDIDLQGKILKIPQNVTLDFRGGRFRNGELSGQDTKILYSDTIFDKVIISGSWICPRISTSMFADLNYGNSLKDVVALINPSIKNKVVIEEGRYTIYALNPTESCILVKGNTEMIINGTIELAPNEYSKYYMIHILGDNVTIKGKGELIGDRPNHLGTSGEWGFGIYINKSNHVSISNITVRDCWGDCIYVGGQSTDVSIRNCTLSHSRRQGISITSAENVLIKGCCISRIEGTAPEYGIDIEPNQKDTVRNVVIRDVVISDCIGGMMAYGNAEGAYISCVDVKNCNVHSTKRSPLRFIGCHKVKAINCNLKGTANLESVLCEDVSQATIKRNHFLYIKLNEKGLKGAFKRILRKTKRINLLNCTDVNVGLNWESE